MTLAVYNFFGQFQSDWSLVSADIVLTILPGDPHLHRRAALDPVRRVRRRGEGITAMNVTSFPAVGVARPVTTRTLSQ